MRDEETYTSQNTEETRIERRQKVYEVKGATLSDNTISGSPSVMGVMDRGGDVIYPGAFKKTLKDFLENGFVAVGHAWGDLAVAYPTVAKEVGNKLYSEAIFHSTQSAQDARTVAKERIEAGKSVGLSIGFSMDWGEGIIAFPNGAELLKHAEGSGHDMTLFDSAGIKTCKSYCYAITQVKELFEWSIVTVPMNPHAIATDVKSYSLPIEQIENERTFEKFLREVGGFSRARAVSITLHGFKANQRDSEETEIAQKGEESSPDALPEAVEDHPTMDAPTDDNNKSAQSAEEAVVEETGQRPATAELMRRTLALRTARLHATL